MSAAGQVLSTGALLALVGVPRGEGAYLGLPLPWCARCRTAVSQVDRWYHVGAGEFAFSARCHGEVEVVRLPYSQVERELSEPGRFGLGVVLKLSVAFLGAARALLPASVAALADLGARWLLRRRPPALPVPRCERCGATEGVQRVPSMTAYQRSPTRWELALHRREVRELTRAQEVATALCGERVYFFLPDWQSYSVPDEVANRDVLLCGPCGEEHADYWQERWAEYWGSR